MNNNLPDSGERIDYGDGKAVREPATGKGRFDLISPFALMRIAKHYENGAKKYASRNWEKGMPYSRCLDSALRHITTYISGGRDEDHLAAACWNLMCIMHFQDCPTAPKDLNDLPNYTEEVANER